jgi:hypothetical protein
MFKATTERIQFEVIGPEMAIALLASSNNFRKTSARRLASYAGMMRRGAWGLSDSIIAIGRDGKLMNGFTRLSAVVESGLPQTFIVMRGTNPDMLQYIDNVGARTAADLLKGLGHAADMPQWKVNLMAGVTRLLVVMPHPWEAPVTAADYPMLYSDVREFVDYAISKVFDRIPTITTAPVLAAVARAKLACAGHKDAQDRLDVFMEHFSRYEDPEDEVKRGTVECRRLRDRLINGQSKKYGAEAIADIYRESSFILAHVVHNAELPKFSTKFWSDHATKREDWLPMPETMRDRLLGKSVNVPSVKKSREPLLEMRDSIVGIGR